jgi:hypothetical protein
MKETRPASDLTGRERGRCARLFTPTAQRVSIGGYLSGFRPDVGNWSSIPIRIFSSHDSPRFSAVATVGKLAFQHERPEAAVPTSGRIRPPAGYFDRSHLPPFAEDPEPTAQPYRLVRGYHRRSSYGGVVQRRVIREAREASANSIMKSPGQHGV